MISDVRVRCCTCKCIFILPFSLYDCAKHSESVYFYCPYGHEQHFLQNPEDKVIPKKKEETPNDTKTEVQPGNVVSLFKKDK